MAIERSLKTVGHQELLFSGANRSRQHWHHGHPPAKLQRLSVTTDLLPKMSWVVTIPDSLIQQLVRKRVVPFVGSGVSLSVQPKLFPTWDKLLPALADRLQKESKENAASVVRLFVDSGKLNKAADEALDELGAAHFRAAMREIFDVDQTADADLTLPDAIWSLRPKLIVTTNYDCVLQWSNSAARTATNSQKANLAHLFDQRGTEKPLVWHLHGHIDDPDSLILAPQQYDRLYRESADDEQQYAAARLQLRNLIGNYPLLFVGFGMQDEYVMDAIATVLAIFGGNLRPSYALLKKGDDRARILWEKHNIQVIEFADYGASLVDLVAEIANQTTVNSDEPASVTATASDNVRRPASIDHYVNRLAQETANLTLLGMGRSMQVELPIVEAYVPLRTTMAGRSRSTGQIVSATFMPITRKMLISVKFFVRRPILNCAASSCWVNQAREKRPGRGRLPGGWPVVTVCPKTWDYRPQSLRSSCGFVTSVAKRWLIRTAYARSSKRKPIAPKRRTIASRPVKRSGMEKAVPCCGFSMAWTKWLTQTRGRKSPLGYSERSRIGPTIGSWSPAVSPVTSAKVSRWGRNLSSFTSVHWTISRSNSLCGIGLRPPTENCSAKDHVRPSVPRQTARNCWTSLNVPLIKLVTFANSAPTRCC